MIGAIHFLAATLAAAAAATSDLGRALPTVDLGYQVHRAISFDETYKTYNFTNIPFAEPPLGSLRFNAPIPPKGRKTGIQNGSIGKVCPQVNPGWFGIGFQFAAAYGADKLPFNYTQAEETVAKSPPAPIDPRTTEDCLVLDVLVPKAVFDKREPQQGHRKPKGAPVLVWIYGGGYVIGDKNMMGTPHDLLAATQNKGGDGAIWVAMNYRLGAFGFLAGPSLQANGTANAGLRDQRLALEWVQAHIHKFGGDAENVTIMGVSAGGGSVMHQITAYGGLKPVPFRRAVPQSSGLVPNPGTQQQEDDFQEFLSLLNVSSLQEARSLPSSALIAANAKQISNAPYGAFVYGPVVDNDFVPGPPTKLLIQGAFAKNVAILSSHNSREGVLFTDPLAFDNETLLHAQIQAIFPRLTAKNLDYVFRTLYPPTYGESQPYKNALDRAQLLIAEAAIICNQNAMMKAATQHGTAAFGYQFSDPPALHGSDQPYIFSNGPTLGVDASISSFMKNSIAEFVTQGIPADAVIGGVHFPPYGMHMSVVNLLGNASAVIRDPTANVRCAWWQKALYY